MKPFGFHRAAREEVNAAARYYAAISPELGRRFYDEVDGLVHDICEAPLRYRAFDPPARRHLGEAFPYAMIYLDEPDRVWIVAVMHFKQRPGYWKSRMH